VTARALELIVPVLAGESCARCDGDMVLTPDAIGRLRKRCPRCDGVSRKRVRHPDDPMLPQALVRVQAPATLPAIGPGQLRCQRCARGVPVNRRFCDACRPTGTPVRVCVCLGCGRQAPRQGGAPTRKTCPVCKPTGTRKARVYPPRACRWQGCDRLFTPTGPRAFYCEAHR
jgi:hypothetical protein